MFTLHTPHTTSKTLTERQQRIFSHLRANPVGVLATVTPNNEPHGSVIYFTIDKHFKLFFLTKSDTKKYHNLKQNSQVMLTVFDPKNQVTAQVAGYVTELEDPYMMNVVAGAIMAASIKTSDAGLPPISKLQAGQYVAFSLEPSQIRMAVYGRPDPGEYNDLFETIESFELRNV